MNFEDLPFDDHFKKFHCHHIKVLSFTLLQFINGNMAATKLEIFPHNACFNRVGINRKNAHYLPRLVYQALLLPACFR